MAERKCLIIEFLKMINLIFLLIFKPERFKEKEEADNKYQASLKKDLDIRRSYKLRHALFSSFLLIFLTGAIGLGIGYLLSNLRPNPNLTSLRILQIMSGLILLWATLSVRGWDIQTIGGTSLTERVNQLIYKSLFIIGTLLFTISTAWK